MEYSENFFIDALNFVDNALNLAENIEQNKALQANSCRLHGHFANSATLMEFKMTNIVPLLCCHQKGNIRCIYDEADKAKNNKSKTFNLTVTLKYPFKEDFTPTAFIYGCYIIYRDDNKTIRVGPIKGNCCEIFKEIVRELANESVFENYKWTLRISFSLSTDKNVYRVLPQEYVRKTNSENKLCTFVIQIKINDWNAEESFIEMSSNSFDVTYSLLDYSEQMQGFKEVKKRMQIKRKQKAEASESDHEEGTEAKRGKEDTTKSKEKNANSDENSSSEEKPKKRKKARQHEKPDTRSEEYAALIRQVAFLQKELELMKQKDSIL